MSHVGSSKVKVHGTKTDLCRFNLFVKCPTEVILFVQLVVHRGTLMS